MQLWQYLCLLTTAGMLYMFRTLLASIIRLVEHCQCSTDLGHLYRIYSIPTHDKHQWLLLQFIVLLMMDARGVQNMQSIPVIVNKHNTARVASCWFIIYYRLAMHGNLDIKDQEHFKPVLPNQGSAQHCQGFHK